MKINKKDLLWIGPAILTVIWMIILLIDVINGKSSIVTDIIWIVILAILTVISYKLKDEKDDERDEYIEAKTDQKMYKIAKYVIFILGAICTVAASIVYTNVGFTTLTIVLMSVGITLLLVWNLLMILNFVVYAIIYQKS